MSGSLRILDASMRYGAIEVLQHISTPELPAGSVTALIGPNGTGKSTLLRGIAGLQAMQGQVRLGERDLARLPAAARANHVVYLPQSLPARSRLAVFDAVLSAAMAGRRHGGALWPRAPGAQTLQAVEATLSRLRLDALADRSVATLSGGQRQLVGLAQALVRRPEVLLLDEPTSALDLRHQYQVIDLVKRETRKRRLVTLIVLHDINLALEHADQVLVLHDGQLASSGPPASVIDTALLARVYGVRGEVACVAGRHIVLVHGPVPDSQQADASR